MGLALTIPVECQTAPAVSGGPPPTVAELLTRYRISLSEDALISALSHSNAEIRYLAAEQLAAQGSKNSIPAIARALKAERVPVAQVNIALSLTQLGDLRGVQTLRDDCDAASIPVYLRLRAASYLLDVHDETCVQVVVAALHSDTDYGNRIQALSLIPRFSKLSATESYSLRTLMLNTLKDPSPAVRLAASDTVRSLGNPDTIPYLETAISAEQNAAVRAQMESDLQRMRSTAK